MWLLDLLLQPFKLELNYLKKRVSKSESRYVAETHCCTSTPTARLDKTKPNLERPFHHHPFRKRERDDGSSLHHTSGCFLSASSGL